jgi:hypothetical protein
MEVKPGDFVRFSRIITKPHRLAEPRVERQGGSGLVLSVNKTPQRIATGVGINKRIDAFRVARIDAGPWMGVVTAVLNDAAKIGEQEQLW